MMNLNDLFQNQRKNTGKSLRCFFTLKWGDTLLWSHDLEHHRRVWYYAKEILEAEAGKTVIETKDSGTEKITRNGKIDIDKLIIACFLHDLGMSEDQGVRHGHISRELGISF
jgi:HD superfamily phosphodiesterase